MNFKVLSWLMGDYESGIDKAEYLLKTASMFGYEVEFMGVNQPYINFLQKLPVLEKALEGIDEDTIVLAMDAWDTLFNVPRNVLIERFRSMGTGLLISSEKMFTYQYHDYKENYDAIPSEYRYVNAGTFIGYAGTIRWLIDGCKEVYEELKADVDQGLIGAWIHDHLWDREIIRLDTNCDIFWVTSKDWTTLKNISNNKSIIYNPTTYAIPCVIHNVGNGHPIHRESYEEAYVNIIKRD